MPDAEFTGSDVFYYRVMNASSDSVPPPVSIRVYDSGTALQLGDSFSELSRDRAGAFVALSSDVRVVAFGIPGCEAGADDAGEVRVFEF